MPDEINPLDIVKQEEMVSLANVDDPTIQDIIATYGDDDFIGNIKLSKDTIKKMVKFAKKMSYGSYAFLSIICLGQKGCCYKSTCPVVDNPPLGHECMFEKVMAESIRKRYIESLSVDPANATEVAQIGEIVEADVINARVNAIIGAEGLTLENAVGYDQETGEAITRTEEHVVMRIKERTQDRKDKLFKSFLATREKKMQALASTKGSEDSTVYLGNLRDKFNRDIAKSFAVDGSVVKDASEPDPILEPEKVVKPKRVEQDKTQW